MTGEWPGASRVAEFEEVGDLLAVPRHGVSHNVSHVWVLQVEVVPVKHVHGHVGVLGEVSPPLHQAGVPVLGAHPRVTLADESGEAAGKGLLLLVVAAVANPIPLLLLPQRPPSIIAAADLCGGPPPLAKQHGPASSGRPDAADVLRRVRDEAQAAGRLGDVLRGALETRT